MQYALMIYADPGYHEALSDAERAEVNAGFSALADDARCAGAVQLQPAETATCVRVAGGRTLMTDGRPGTGAWPAAARPAMRVPGALMHAPEAGGWRYRPASAGGGAGALGRSFSSGWPCWPAWPSALT